MVTCVSSNVDYCNGGSAERDHTFSSAIGRLWRTLHLALVAALLTVNLKCVTFLPSCIGQQTRPCSNAVYYGRWADKLQERVAAHLPVDLAEAAESAARTAHAHLVDLNLAVSQLLTSLLSAMQQVGICIPTGFACCMIACGLFSLAYKGQRLAHTSLRMSQGVCV